MVVVASARLLVSQLARHLAQLEIRAVKILPDKTLVSKPPLRSLTVEGAFRVVIERGIICYINIRIMDII